MSEFNFNFQGKPRRSGKNKVFGRSMCVHASFWCLHWEDAIFSLMRYVTSASALQVSKNIFFTTVILWRLCLVSGVTVNSSRPVCIQPSSLLVCDKLSITDSCGCGQFPFSPNLTRPHLEPLWITVHWTICSFIGLCASCWAISL